MIKIYLLVNAVLYLLFTVLCLINPNGTAGTLGYSFLNNSGKVEYLTIYTGLELGFAAFLTIAAFSPSMQFSALVFLVCLYAGAMITRTFTGLYYGNVLKVTFLVGALEYALGIWGIVLLALDLKK